PEQITLLQIRADPICAAAPTRRGHAGDIRVADPALTLHGEAGERPAGPVHRPSPAERARDVVGNRVPEDLQLIGDESRQLPQPLPLVVFDPDDAFASVK